MSLLSRLCFLLVLAPLTLAAQDEDYPPGTFQLTPSIDLNLQPVQVEIPPQFKDDLPEGLTLNLPPGFSISVFAVQNLRQPRSMAISPDGVLYVGNMGRDQIMAFPDLDGDGIADEGIVAVEDIDEAHGFVFYQDALYVADENQVLRLRDLDGDHVYEEREIFIPDIPWEGWHDTRTIAVDKINQKFYVSVGSPCDLCRQQEGLQVVGNTSDLVPYSPERGAVIEVNTDGSGRRIFATGVRNVIGMELHPVTNELWGNNNHFDLAGAELPPEWIDIIRDGGFYGLPFAYGYQTWIDFSIPQYRKILPITQADSLQVESMRRPVALVPAHLAPMDLHFYTGDLFPDNFKNAALVALRGGKVQGNLASVPGFKVMALFSEPDGSNARIADFLTGFDAGPRRDDLLGKPVGLTSDDQGNLYVTSDTNIYAIYRISHSPLIPSWQHALPTSIASGAQLAVDLTVHLERQAPEGEPVLTADLSAFGGPSALALEPLGDNSYQLKTTVEIAVANGLHPLRIQIEQGPFSTQLVQQITVLPSTDEAVFAGAEDTSWDLKLSSRIAPNPDSPAQTYEGRTATAFNTTPSGLSTWTMELIAPERLNPAGYRGLRLALHPGDLADDGFFSLAINGSASPDKSRTIDLLAGLDSPGVDLSVAQWQVIEIPMDALDLPGTIERIRIFGSVAGTFYLGDVSLVAQAAEPPSTAVLETYTESEPLQFQMGQNYPNPFNSETIIRFSLPHSGPVDLGVYNLAGQKVASLIAGQRGAGLYSVHWDGRDDSGRDLASGLYFYSLRAGGMEQTHKLLLLR